MHNVHAMLSTRNVLFNKSGMILQTENKTLRVDRAFEMTPVSFPMVSYQMSLGLPLDLRHAERQKKSNN